MRFTLLLSKKSKLGEAFMKRFDKELAAMKKSGEFDATIKLLHNRPQS